MATTEVQLQTLDVLCDFQTGYNVRGKLELGEGGTQVIQLKDISPSGFDAGALGRVNLEKVSWRYAVEEGDIVFRTRFEPNIAYRLMGLNDSAIVLAPIVILRPKTNAIDPDYLVWFIRQAPAQRYLDGIRQGTNLPQIPIDELKRLPVPLPSIEVQRKFVTISELAEREHALRLEIAEKRKEITSFALLAQVRKTRPHMSGPGSEPLEGVGAPKSK